MPINKARIFRYPLKIDDYQEVWLPTSHKILSVAPSRDTYSHPLGVTGSRASVQGIDMWARVAPSHFDDKVGVWLVGTGNPMPTREGVRATERFEFLDDDDFIGTCVMNNGLVWHVYTQVVKV